MKTNVSRLVQAVAEGCDPSLALSDGTLTHPVPVWEASFSGKDLENLYGDQFTSSGKVNEFQPIDTGAGVRIRSIKVQRRGYEGRERVNLPHRDQSRIYVTKREDNDKINKAMDATFKSGVAPVDALHDEGSPAGNAISDMMAIRRPENNPHEANRDIVLPHVFKHLGMTGSGANGLPHAQWHCQAGCGGCPCSPGFIVHKSSHQLARNHDIWVEVD